MEESPFGDIQPHIVLKAWEFHEQNPHVFDLFQRFCAQARSSGKGSYGAKAIFERIRWELNIQTVGDSEFKLNNNYTAFYSRMLELEDPSFKGFFATRSSRGDEDVPS